jgi:hypothetical protein
MGITKNRLKEIGESFDIVIPDLPGARLWGRNPFSSIQNRV